MTRPMIPANEYYRVSVKALIRNDEGKILLVKERNGSSPSLPGGGLDHGESMQDGLRREMFEEVNFRGDYTSKLFATLPFYVEPYDTWMLWVVYEVVPESYDFSPGIDGEYVGFYSLDEVDPATRAGKAIHTILDGIS